MIKMIRKQNKKILKNQNRNMKLKLVSNNLTIR